MSSYDVAEEIRAALPETDEIFVQYLAGYLLDDAAEDEDAMSVARLMLESAALSANTKDTTQVSAIFDHSCEELSYRRYCRSVSI